jgi:hypothetical protein
VIGYFQGAPILRASHRKGRTEVIMPAKRPMIISVIGILNIVLGGLGLLTSVCCGGIGLIFLSVASKTELPADHPLAPMIAQLKRQNEMQGNFAMQIAGVGMAALTGTLLVVSGIGFLKMKQWGRHAGLAYAAIGIVWAIAVGVLQAQLAGPTLAEVNKDIQAKTGQANPVLNSPALANFAVVFGLLYNLAYPITMLILMLIPAVKTGLAGKSVLSSIDEDSVLEAGPDTADGNEQ